MQIRRSASVSFWTLVTVLAAASAHAVTIDWVTVGNTGNRSDSLTGGIYGNVDYEYRISAHEVTLGQYAEFLNAAAKANPLGQLYGINSVYHYNLASNLNTAGISQSGTSGSYQYAVMDNSGLATNRPVTYVNWYDAARFANWMNNGQGAGSTESGAYAIYTGTVLSGTRAGNVNTYTMSSPTAIAVGDVVSITLSGSNGFDLTGVVTSRPSPTQFTVDYQGVDAVAGSGWMIGAAAVHSPTAKYWLPTENEWYKAAYYDPTIGGGAGGYYRFATSSDTAPGNSLAAGGNQANYKSAVGGTATYATTQTGSYSATQNYLTDVASLGNRSHYGTYDQSGNAAEWLESSSGSTASQRVLRGGDWTSNSYGISSAARLGYDPRLKGGFGFRLAAASTNAATPVVPPMAAAALFGIRFGGAAGGQPTSTGSVETSQTFSAPGTGTSNFLGGMGTGVSGAAGDEAFSLLTASGMGSGYTGPHVSVGFGASAPTVTSFTIAGWIKPDRQNLDRAALMELTVAQQLSLSVVGLSGGVEGAASRLRLIGLGIDATSAFESAYSTADQWGFFAITYAFSESEQALVFYEGTSARPSAVSAAFSSVSSPREWTFPKSGVSLSLANKTMYFGSRAEYGDAFRGLMDDLFFFDSALSAADIEQVRVMAVPEASAFALLLAGGFYWGSLAAFRQRNSSGVMTPARGRAANSRAES